jgi:hypothetical protein
MLIIKFLSKIRHTTIAIFLTVLFLVTLFFTGHHQNTKLYAKEDTSTKKSVYIVQSMQTISPSYYCGGSQYCVPSTSPTLAPSATVIISQPIDTQSPTQEIATTTSVSPTVDPCVQTTVTSAAAHKPHWKAHKKGTNSNGQNGAMSNFFQIFLNFLMQFINMLLQLFGMPPIQLPGGVVPSGSPTPGVSATPTGIDSTPTPTASVNPCVTNEPTIPPTDSSQPTTTVPTTSVMTPSPSIATISSTTQPIAVVFRGPATSCCAEAMASMLQADTNQNFKIIYAGGTGDQNVETALATPGVKLYAQPGGDGDSYVTAYDEGFANDPGAKAAIQSFVNNGGRYIGICMGAWFTASDAFDLIPGSVEDWPTTSGAEQTDATANVLVNINWKGTNRKMFYQGGPNMVVNSGVTTTVLGTFNNGKVATVIIPYGNGKLGLSGPHPEAQADWYSSHNLEQQSTQDIANEFIDTLMQ